MFNATKSDGAPAQCLTENLDTKHPINCETGMSYAIIKELFTRIFSA